MYSRVYTKYQFMIKKFNIVCNTFYHWTIYTTIYTKQSRNTYTSTKPTYDDTTQRLVNLSSFVYYDSVLDRKIYFHILYNRTHMEHFQSKSQRRKTFSLLFLENGWKTRFIYFSENSTNVHKERRMENYIHILCSTPRAQL